MYEPLDAGIIQVVILQVRKLRLARVCPGCLGGATNSYEIHSRKMKSNLKARVQHYLENSIHSNFNSTPNTGLFHLGVEPYE